MIILGDLNDYSAVDLDVAGNTPTSRTLAILRDLDLDGTDELASATRHVPAARRYSATYGNNQRSQIDHVLLSAGLDAKVSAVHIDHCHDPSASSPCFPRLPALGSESGSGRQL